MPEARAREPLREADLNRLFGTIREPLRLAHPPGTLTVAMIVKDEAANIRAAVEGLRPIADQIVINDTGSTDGTQAILSELGVEWFQSAWPGGFDFSAARNQGLERARCAWVLWMDADDRLPPEQAANFLKLKTAPLDRVFGFQVINTVAGRPLGTRFLQVRMFPNHPSMRFENKVHEQIVFAAARLGLHCFYTDAVIHHTGYEDEGLKRAKAGRNLALLEAGEREHGLDPALAMSRGDSLYILERWEEGIAAYRAALDMPGCEAINPQLHHALPASIGRGYQKLARYGEALEWLERAVALEPAQVEPRYYRAECLMALGRAAEAAEGLRRILDLPPAPTSAGSQYDVVRMYGFFHLARLEREAGDPASAAARLEAMHREYPPALESWHLLGRCRLELGDAEAAVAAWERGAALLPAKAADLFADLIALLARLGRKGEHARYLARARALHPGLRLREGGPRLSLCMIVKDEAPRLGDCLDSARGLADEVIVVDTGSADGTQAIARDRGAVVVQSTWEGDFSRARNLSLERATGRWILWLDADDRLLPEDARALRAQVEEADAIGLPRAFGLLVKNSQDGGRTGSVFNQIRVFPNRPDLRFRAPVHEQILPALEEARVPVEYLGIKVLHTGYAGEGAVRRKQERNRAILEAQLARGEGITPVTLFTLANACLDLGDEEAAERHYAAASRLAAERGGDPHIRAIAPAKRAAILARRGRYAEAEAVLRDTPDPAPPEALLVGAQLAAAAGRRAEARSRFEALLGLREGNSFIPVDVQYLKLKALEALAKDWRDEGRGALAVDLLKAALAAGQGRDLGPGDLRDLYLRHGVG